MIDFDDIEEQLKSIPSLLKNGHGGFEAQMRMAPEERRKDVERYMQSGKDARKGAVLILLFPFHGNIYISLIKRPTYVGVHSGQIAFPGGKAENGDKNLLHTALREAYEEVNITSDIVEGATELTSIYIPPSNFLVTPYVAFSKDLPDFKADPKEVEEILFLPITELWEDENIKLGDFNSANYLVKNYPYYDFSIGRVWGASAMMLAELKQLLNPNKISF